MPGITIPPLIAPPEVMYHGVKSYWKTRSNVDVTFINHSQISCIEVASFLMEDVSELPRIYVDSAQLRSKLDPEILKKKIDEKKEGFIRQHKPFDQTALTKEITINSMCQFLLNNLQLVKEEHHVHLFIAPSASDPEQENSLSSMVISKPGSLVAYNVAKPAKISSSADIHHVLTSLKAESAELRNATRLAQLATSSIDGFKLMLAEKLKIENQMKGKYSVPRLRWIKAIKRVLIQNYANKVRKRLGLSTEDVEDGASVDKFDVTASGKIAFAHHGMIPASMSMDGAESISSDSMDDQSLYSISFDQAGLHGHELPTIKNGRRRRNKSHHHKISFLHQDSLPSLDVHMSAKQIFQTAPLTPSKSMSTIQQRRSLDNSHFTTFENLLPTIPIHDEYGERRAPSLLESYHNISQRIQTSSSVPMLTTNSRSIRTVRMTIS